MSDYKYMKPAKPGLIVRDPGTKAELPATGMLVPWTGKVGRYWRRRLISGDIVEVRAPEPKVQEEPAPSKKKPEPKKDPVSSIEKRGFPEKQSSDPGPSPEEIEDGN